MGRSPLILLWTPTLQHGDAFEGYPHLSYSIFIPFLRILCLVIEILQWHLSYLTFVRYIQMFVLVICKFYSTIMYYTEYIILTKKTNKISSKYSRALLFWIGSLHPSRWSGILFRSFYCQKSNTKSEFSFNARFIIYICFSFNLHWTCWCHHPTWHSLPNTPVHAV
jgi:hypothetical protein